MSRISPPDGPPAEAQAVAEPGRLQERLVDVAERREVRGVVEDLEAARADQALLPLVVGRLDVDVVDTVRQAGRVEEDEETGARRVRDVRVVGRDVGAVDAEDGLALEESVDEDVDVLDSPVVEGPPDDLEDAVGVNGGVRLREVEDAERGLVPRVVDPDRACGEEVAAARDVGDPDVELVRAVRVVRSAERHLEARGLSRRPRVLRERLADVGPREVDVRSAGRRDAVRLVRAVDVEVDVRDEVPVQREPGHADEARDESALRRNLDRSDGLRGTALGRAVRERGRAERQEDRRRHRKDQSVELHQSSSPGSRGLRFTVTGRLAEQAGNFENVGSFAEILGAPQSPVN